MLIEHLTIAGASRVCLRDEISPYRGEMSTVRRYFGARRDTRVAGEAATRNPTKEF